VTAKVRREQSGDARMSESLKSTMRPLAAAIPALRAIARPE